MVGPPRSTEEPRYTGSIPLARDHVGFVEEPEPAVLPQDAAGGVKVAAVADHLGEALVLDLRHVDRGVPGREQRRGSDGVADLAWQRVHVVTEDRAVVRVGIEVEIAAGVAELGLGDLQELVPVGPERILAGPDLLHDLEAGTAAIGMDGEQPATGREAAR